MALRTLHDFASTSASPSAERTLRGTPISAGLGFGSGFIHYDLVEGRGAIERIETHQVEAEMERILAALGRVREELLESASRIGEQLGPELAEIFRSHQAMLDGILAAHEFESELGKSLVTAPHAVRNVFRRWESKFATLPVESFRQRADDVLDLARRVLRQLEVEQAHGLASLPEGSVLIARRLLPSDVVAFSTQNPTAILVEALGPGSHAALLARELSIPVVAGLPGLLDLVAPRDELLVDASGGIVVVSPGVEARSRFELRLEEFRQSLFRCKGECHAPAVTRDGTPVRVEANLASRSDVALLVENGADGVGLFRLERLYLARELPPREDELLDELEELLAPLHALPVTLRLLDIGGDKMLPSLRFRTEANPALGLRGVRLLLDHPELLDTQLRAILRLSQRQTIRILVPMITFADDFTQVRERLLAHAETLGVGRLPLLGAMIETPAAALTVAEIATHADFLCVGSNDLAQYTLAAGRDDATVSQYYRDDHPSVLRLLQFILDDASGKPVTLCGELAGREEMVPSLLAMGFRGLSIAPRLIPTTKERVRSMDLGTPVAVSA